MQSLDVIIIGAGAAGLMCAIEAGKRHRRVLVLDHANKPGKKILMSGGGRCNFTNYHVSPAQYLSHNPHFCKSALKRYTQWDFIALVQQHGILFHEKAHGQLFCDNKSKEIVDMLLVECQKAAVQLQLECRILSLTQITGGFKLITTHGTFQTQSLVIATGGLSIPTMGATPFGYQVAEQFGLKVWPTRAGLVPLTLHPEDKERFVPLSGVSVPARVGNTRTSFQENILFTHRGLSGPAILQMSSYWEPGESLTLNLHPELDLYEHLLALKGQGSKRHLKNILTEQFPKSVIAAFFEDSVLEHSVVDCAHQTLAEVANTLQQWELRPNGTEGYRTAEVTLGGVDCDAISSKTFEATKVPGLYFIGEVLDVTGWLGGFNFQWAWSSGWAAGQVV